MSRKEEYKRSNQLFLEEVVSQEDIQRLSCGVLYKVIEQGKGTVSPTMNSIVTVHYNGKLINGREFDNTHKQEYPEVFRLNQVIEGWQQALFRMCTGDKWIIYIPYNLGYGNRTNGSIPAFSTLIFEVELLSIA